MFFYTEKTHFYTQHFLEKEFGSNYCRELLPLHVIKIKKKKKKKKALNKGKNEYFYESLHNFTTDASFIYSLLLAKFKAYGLLVRLNKNFISSTRFRQGFLKVLPIEVFYSTHSLITLYLFRLKFFM